MATEPEGAVSNAAAVWAGAVVTAPLMIFIVPFGLYSGVVAAEAGLDLAETLALSIIVFAGASQLAAIELIRSGAPAVVIVASALAVNLRFLMYSAAVAPRLRAASPAMRIGAGYFLVDNVAATFLAWRQVDAAGPAARFWFVAAGGSLSWVAWQLGAVVGHQVGAAALPDRLLAGIGPIAFLALAAPLLTSAPRWIAAAIAVVAAVALHEAPYQLNVIIAAALGVAVGVALPVPDAPREDAADQEPGDGPQAASQETPR